MKAVRLAITAANVVLSSLIHTVWQLDLSFGLMLGLGTGLVASVLGATIAIAAALLSLGIRRVSRPVIPAGID